MTLLNIGKHFYVSFVGLGFLNSDNAPIPEAAAALPQDLLCPSQDINK